MAKGPQPKPWLERFENLFIPEPMSGCWLWLGGLQTTGYGNFSVARSKSEGAHRVAWKLYRGPIPLGAHVLHNCDNKQCVNPDHLHLGTHADNMAEYRSRPHWRPVARKLTPQTVREIRAATGTLKEIGARYGVAFSMVSMVRSRRLWAHVD